MDNLPISRIFGLLPPKFDATLRCIFGMSKNALFHEVVVRILGLRKLREQRERKTYSKEVAIWRPTRVPPFSNQICRSYSRPRATSPRLFFLTQNDSDTWFNQPQDLCYLPVCRVSFKVAGLDQGGKDLSQLTYFVSWMMLSLLTKICQWPIHSLQWVLPLHH